MFMSEKTEKRGICSTCKYSKNCALPYSHKEPLLECEEFDVEQPVFDGLASAKKPMPVVGADLDPEMFNQSKYNGLCKNCENLKTCAFPKPEAGVWHCEEYQ